MKAIWLNNVERLAVKLIWCPLCSVRIGNTTHKFNLFLSPRFTVKLFSRGTLGAGGGGFTQYRSTVRKIGKYQACKNSRFPSLLDAKEVSARNVPSVKERGETAVFAGWIRNRRNTDTAFIIGRAYLKLYPCRVFVYLKHVNNRNQPQPSRENLRRPRTDRYSDRKARSLDVLQFHHRVTVRNCVFIYR